MIGVVVSIKPVGDDYNEVIIKHYLSGREMIMTLPSSLEYAVGSKVSIYTTVTELSNANFGHEYPEGTIGTF